MPRPWDPYTAPTRSPPRVLRGVIIEARSQILCNWSSHRWKFSSARQSLLWFERLRTIHHHGTVLFFNVGKATEKADEQTMKKPCTKKAEEEPDWPFRPLLFKNPSFGWVLIFLWCWLQLWSPSCKSLPLTPCVPLFPPSLTMDPFISYAPNLLIRQYPIIGPRTRWYFVI